MLKNQRLMRGRPLRLNFRRHRFFGVMLFFLWVSVATSQNYLIVRNENNEALEGVLVFDESKTFSALSDQNGKVLLSKNFQYPLSISYLGYETLSYSEKQLLERNYSIVLKSEKLLLEEVVLIGRNEIAQEDLPYESTTISPLQIKLSNAQTSADALSANSNVYVQKSQMGGGSPVVRGFEANKLLLVVDGVRLNNAIYRSGHLQNAITIDPAILESLDVVFGPGSLMYGSDALGGVVHFQSRSLKPKAHNPGDFTPSYYFRWGTANSELTAHGDIEYYGKNWGSFTSLTLSRYLDQKTGSNRLDKYPENYGLRLRYIQAGYENEEDLEIINEDPHILKFTAYEQYDLLQKFTFAPTDNLEFTWNTQFSTSTNIPRYDALTEKSGDQLRYSQWDYGPQQRILSSLTSRYLFKNNSLFDKLTSIVSYQNINESRITSRFQSDLVNTQDERLDIVNATLDLSGSRDYHQWFIGADGNYNHLKSQAFQQLYTEDSKNPGGLTRYPNDLGKTFSSGLYAQYYYLPSSWYKVNLGIRYDYNQVDIRFKPDNVFIWPDFFYDGLTNKNHSLNWSSGIHFSLPYHFKIRLLGGSSFRAPNIDDIAKIRLNNDEISIPNASLRPEKSLNAEITFGFQPKNTNISATLFYTHLTDAINRQNSSLPSGESIYITEGDTFIIVTNINNENALVRGLSINLKHTFTDELSLDGSINFTRGDILENGSINSPLAHIPPTYGRLFLEYNRNKWTTRSGIRFNGIKNIERFGGSIDNPEFATEEGSLSWYTLHLTAAYEIHSSLTLQLSVDNLLDQFYVPFSSGLPGMGRNIGVMLRGTF